MPYYIGDECVDVQDRSCVEECPVDCIYEGERKLYIQPDECIDCGACLPACPMEAIGIIRYADESRVAMAADNRAFFEEVLPGREAPLGAPAGGGALGVVGTDTRRVRDLPVGGR